MKSAAGALVDTHCHLNQTAFEQDLGPVLQRAHGAGISKILVPGIDLESSRSAVELADEHEPVYAAVGFHPHDAKTWERSAAAELKELARHPKVVAIGEIGLDYYRNYSDPTVQREVFNAQLDIAHELQLPVVVHNREAIQDVLPILQDWGSGLPERLDGRAGVLHAYSSDLQAASKAIELGFYIGIAGPVTYKKADALRDVVSALPLERILVETDAPYLTPDPHRGKRNEPCYVEYVVNAIANVRQMQESRVGGRTAENAHALFEWNHEISNRNIL